MAITTIDGIVAGMQPPYTFMKNGSTMEAAGTMHSLFYTVGNPNTATTPSPGINGAALTSYSGQLPFSNPASGNTYLARLAATANQVGTLILCDRLWHNSGITVTTTGLQAITSGAMPARDRNGSTNGDGLMAAIEVSGAMGNGAVSNTILVYTNSGGTAGRTATLATTPASLAAGTFLPFRLNPGDSGIRLMAGGSEGLVLGTSYVSGTMHLVIYRELARIDVTTANVGSAIDAITSGFPRFYDNSVPFLVFIPSTTTGVNISGQIIYTQG